MTNSRLQLEQGPAVSFSSSDTPAGDARLLRAVLALGVGGFSIGTGEFVIMGLLPEVAHDLGLSIPQAGHVISAYALGVVIGAPALAVLAIGLIRWGVPSMPPVGNASPLRELQVLRNVNVWLTLGIGAIGFGGMFAVFSYIKPTLTEVAGLPLARVPLMLALFGTGM